MALINTTASGSSTDKSISIVHYNGTADTNKTYYTVPEGRKFKGVVWVNANNYELGKLPGHTGGNHYNPPSTSHYYIEVGAGDFVSGYSQYAYHSLVGIESDV